MYIKAILSLIEAIPLIEKLFTLLYQEYLAKKYQMDILAFRAADIHARKTGDTTELKKILGRRRKA